MIKFTEDQIEELICYGYVNTDDDEETLYEVVHEETVSFDKEKSSADIEYVVKELSTGKFYKATLLNSQWYGQNEYNARQEWKEVFPHKETITTYR